MRSRRSVPLARNTEPGANRSSGSSVRMSTTTSPVTPCALTTRPTVNSTQTSPLLVGVHHVDTNATATDAGDQCAQRGRGTPAATDHLAEVFGMDMHFNGPATPAGHQIDTHIVGVVDDPADQVFDGVNDDGTHGGGQLSVAGSACSAAASAAAGAAASSAGLAAASALSAGLSAAAFFAGAF